jgi:N4-(beta-N-acetylglucosaminyl)-L-asparaginase
MHGPKRRAGAVAAIGGRAHAVARGPGRDGPDDHHLLVGKGAQDFARNVGFTIEADLNTPKSRAAWLEWKRRIDPGHYPDAGGARGDEPQDQP